MRFRCLLTSFLFSFSLSLFAQGEGHYTQGMHYYSAAIQSQNNGDLNKAIEQITSAAEHFHEVKRLKETEVKSLLLLARWLNKRNGDGDLDKAIITGEKALKIWNQKKSSLTSEIYSELALIYSRTDQAEKADNARRRAIDIAKLSYGEKSLDYARMLHKFSVNLQAEGNIPEALRYANESVDIFCENNDTLSTEFANIIHSASIYYRFQEEYEQQARCLSRALNAIKSSLGQDSDLYLAYNAELMQAYQNAGNNEKANDILANLQATAAMQEITNESQAKLMANQAEQMAFNGNFAMAVTMQQRVIDFYKNSKDKVQLAKAYTTQILYSRYTKQYEEAIAFGDEAIQILLSHKDIRKPQSIVSNTLATVYNNLATIYYAYGSNESFPQDKRRELYDKAIEYGNSSIALYTLAGDTATNSFAQLLSSSATYSFAIGDTDEAIRLSKQALTILKDNLGESHPDVVTPLYSLAVYYFAKRDEEQTNYYYHLALELQKEVIRTSFLHMTAATRERYWALNKYVFELAPLLAWQFNNNPKILTDAYNARLLTKGILLNSEISLKTYLAKAPAYVQRQYEHLMQVQKEIEELSLKASKTQDNGPIVKEINNKQRYSVQLEHELQKSLKEFGDYTDNMNITVEDIAAALKPGEIAVEFFQMTDPYGNDNYYALYIKPGAKVPQYVSSLTQHDLNLIAQNLSAPIQELLSNRQGVNKLFSYSMSGHYVWQKLIDSWGDDVKDIYFSPTGIFYKWGIEHLPIGDHEYISDRYTLHRVSSTKNIASSAAEEPLTTSALFGGLLYDLPLDVMKETHTLAWQETDNAADASDLASADAREVAEERSAFSNLQDRGSVGYLAGTKEEVEAIARILESDSVNVRLYEEENGVEEAFKSLSGKRIPLIHIATHGYTFESNSANAHAMAKLTGGGWTAQETDANLNYSGLLFSGANNILERRAIPFGIDDGIVTSREVSRLDFRGTSMVVLSACQTGLGDIKEDGVFGLQRGFKKAGARTLLMSLWKVDDGATKTMMINFYKALITNPDKHAAFLAAQRKVKEAGYYEPYFWASFIMLDD